ncbi:Beta-secretase 2 [Irineochytrium annulatum]|nr:Beta-secretase 2 [Irineochytrium annulatum]
MVPSSLIAVVAPLIALAVLPAPCRTWTQHIRRPGVLPASHLRASRRGRPFVEARDGTGDSEDLDGSPLNTGCWNVDIGVGGVESSDTQLLAQVDSGSSDLLIPGVGLAGYMGPTYDHGDKQPLVWSTLSTTFSDGSSWSGQLYSDTVNVSGLVTTAPFAVIQDQTQDNPIADGVFTQALLGLAFDDISLPYSQGLPGPQTLMTALTTSGAIAHDRFAVRGCTADSNETSYIDWGASNASLTIDGSGQPVGWAKVVSRDHYAVNVVGVTLGGQKQSLGFGWQSFGDQSIVDTCTTLLLLPYGLLWAFIKAVDTSGVLQAAGVKQSLVNGFLTDLHPITESLHAIKYGRFPNLTISMEATDGGVIDITLTGRDYIRSDGNGSLYFPVQSSDDNGLVLGGVVFESFYVVFDRDAGAVGFGPGCGFIK